jgi:hypothetical protein
MRSLALALLALSLGACGDDGVRSYDFGPFAISANEERLRDCVQISLHNDEPLYVSSVELTSGPGFHHSNWMYVPESIFAGPDGTFDCQERGFSEAIGAVFGGVLFAQSTQTPHEVQAFPPGVALKLPPKTKIVSQIHLLNPTDAPLQLQPNLTLTTIPAAQVSTMLAGISFENHSIGLPPHAQSKFTLDCDLAPLHESLFGRDPDFNVFYALAHYHALGTGLTVEAVRPDGTSATVYSTANHIGDTLGGAIDPPFSMTGFTRLRLSCDYFNSRDSTVTWGVGDQEMCVFLAFSDSTRNWGGGAPNDEPPGDPTDVNGVMTYTHPCMVFSTDAEH